MAVSEKSIHYRVKEDEDLCESGGSDFEIYTDDSDNVPSYCNIEETHGHLSRFAINKKSKAQMLKVSDSDDAEIVEPEFDEADHQNFVEVQEFIKAGQVEKLKVEQCKIYLRKHGLRLTGNKATLIQRIKEHLEILNGGGERKYPACSFILNCKGDACTGDIVMFVQNVYEMFNIASRSASGSPCGTRIVAGRIVKESYGAAKQQHTFTIEVLWSKGEKPLPPLYPLLIKGRNLYRLKTLRQKWEDEGERQKVLMEKHSRGSLARYEREARIEEKEKRKMLRANRASRKVSDRQLPQSGFGSTSAPISLQFKTILNSAPNSEMPDLHQKFGLSINYGKPATASYQSCLVNHTNQGSQSERVYSHNHGTDRNLHVNNYQGFYNEHPASIHNYQNINGTKRFSESTVERIPFTSMNNFYPGLSRRQDGLQQLCRHYAQGRCYYGDNCRFFHGIR